MEILCKQYCGFRVDEEFFARKQRFSAGVCPTCASEVVLVREGTNDVVEGYTFQRDRSKSGYGRVVL